MKWRTAAAASSTLLVVLAPTSGAAASERVRDGGFETQTSCPAGDCTSSAWTEFGPVGFLCSAGAVGCDTGAASGAFWAQLGSGNFAEETFYGAIAQPVQMPAAPATLRFELSRTAGAGAASFTVRLDGTTVFTTPNTGITASYVLISVDVSALAGSSHLLSFEATCGATCTRWRIDDVSLDAPDAPSQAPQNAAGGPATVVLSTLRLSKNMKTLSFGVSCPAQRASPCRGKARAETSKAVNLARAATASKGSGVLKLGSARFDIPSGETRTVRIGVLQQARKVLAALAKKVSLKLVLSERDQTSEKTLRLSQARR